MPELPEVETMCRGIAPILGKVIAQVEGSPGSRRPILMRPPLATMRRKLLRQSITGIERRGKRVVVHVGDTGSLVIEPRMTGLVLLADPPTREHLRLTLYFQNASDPKLMFWDRRGLGTVRLLKPAALDQELGSQRIGPDALKLDARLLRDRLAGSQSPVKVALLDQKKIAGIGNLYASEILHVARIDPRTRCCRLTLEQFKAMHAAIEHVLLEAIDHEGSTLSDQTYRNALNQTGSYQSMHRVYDRAGKYCPRCRNEIIQRIVQAQRSTFFCPGCQSRAKRAKARQT